MVWQRRLLVGVCVTVATAAVFWPGSRPDSDPYADLPSVLDPTHQRSAELDADLSGSQRRMELMCVVKFDLIAGRLTLAAAVRRHQDIGA